MLIRNPVHGSVHLDESGFLKGECEFRGVKWQYCGSSNASITKASFHIADVPSDMRVWLERPEVEVPERKRKRGRHSTRKQVIKGEPVEVWKLVEELPEDAWNHIFLWDSEKKEGDKMYNKPWAGFEPAVSTLPRWRIATMLPGHSAVIQ